MKNPPSLLSRLSIFPALRLIVGLMCVAVSGCTSSAYERERFTSDYVRVVHSSEHCKDVDRAPTTEFQKADLVRISDHGIGRFVATRTGWEVIARQLAAELDADLALVRPCDGEYSFKHVQIEVWRTRGFKPTAREEYSSDSGALMTPSQSTYGSQLKDIFGCFEQARVTSGPISPDNKERLGLIDATEFFASGRYFSGSPRVDNYFRPTRMGDLRLSMIYSDREKAAWAANLYRELPSDEKQRFAERYLICLLDRGYGWWPV